MIPVMEKELILKAKAGDGQAYSQIVRGYLQRIYRAAFCMLKNVDDAADICQEAFLRAFRNLSRFDEDRPFYPWIYRILKNLCLNLLKAKKNDPYYKGGMIEFLSNMPDPQAELLKKEQAVNLKRALNTLPEMHREILILKHFDECSYSEISEILSIPAGTVMSRLYNARKLLKESLMKIEGGTHEL